MGEIQSRSFQLSECASSRAGSQDSQVRSREGRMLGVNTLIALGCLLGR